jgi:spore maturation protein CgeB
VEHIDTEPSILFPGETYVPVKWDMSDLLEKCEFYLNNEPERLRITQHARKAFVDYYASKQFLNVIERILTRLSTHGQCQLGREDTGETVQ